MNTRTVQLNDVCERIDYGFTASADFSLKEPRLLRITDIQDGAVDWSRVPGCKIDPHEETGNRLAVGDIVVARTGATTGKSFLIKYTPRAVFASYLIRLRPSPRVSPEYLFGFLQSKIYWAQIGNAVRGAAQGGVNATVLGGVRMPLPNLSEQHKIVGELEKADRLRRMRSYALELSNTLLPAAFLDLFGNPATNPKTLERQTAGNLFEIQLGKMLDAKRITGEHLKPYLGNANVQWGSFDLNDVKLMDFPDGDFRRFKLLPGDILVCEGGEVGRTAIWKGDIADCCYQKALHRLRPKSSTILGEYFLHYMHAAVQSGLVARATSTATIAHFTAERFQDFEVMIPALNLQKEFAAMAERTERLRSVQRESLRQAEHLFQSLLHRTFAEQF